MAGVSSVAVLRDIQTLFDAGTASGLTDRQLLDRFASQRDATAEPAFGDLVLRHGPMVLRVCQNLLHDPNDAQDAFQATFLVLVRRSGSIRKLDSVGGWLYGVACRVAARARVDAARRRSAEKRAALRVVEAVDTPDIDEAGNVGFGPIVQEEVHRLPEKYRAVVALCYWQGRTHEQAAAHLCCPLGTVRSRLARARNLLRRRLTRRGLALLSGVVVAGLEREMVSAATVAWRLSPVPTELVHSTIQTAVRFGAGQTTAQMVSGAAVSLAQSVLWSMTMIKFKVAMAGLVLAGLMGSGGWFASQQGPLAQEQPNAIQKTSIIGKRAKIGDSGKIYSLVEAQKIIVKLVRDGSPVKKGDIVCELDSASLKDQLVNQRVTSKSAEATHQISALNREVAELAVIEYEEGTFKSDAMEVMAEVKIAEAELALAEDELEAVLKLVKAKSVSNIEKKRAELVLLRARWGLEKAQSRRKALFDFTKGKKLKELKSAVDKARSDELFQTVNCSLQVSKEKKLERQISNCTIVASRDGTLVYAPGIEEGATVRERQILFEIVPMPETKTQSR
jgi:HlyD family secretion protein